jgi:intracellular multiplication protein IcmB
LLPQNIQPFTQFFKRILPMNLPWRLSFNIESNGISALGLRPTIASILSFASNDNKLITGASEILNNINNNTDEAVVVLKITATTWGHYLDEKLVRGRLSELAKALQGWGSMETSEVSGDPYQGVMSSALGISMYSVAKASVAPLSEVVYMFPINRPASPWREGAVLFRSTDGKPWPYQPGSSLQTTWIDLIYARPGSGKSVLSNSINLALCLSSGIQRLPRIAIIDIGPSSSGLISLLREALPEGQKHLAVYHRLQMDEKTSINPFDTQLGCRVPTPQDRAFLVNFLTLLATPVGEVKPYDGITDMAGLIVDELYKSLADEAKPMPYASNIDEEVDKKLVEHNIVPDSHATWWEIVDLLFDKGETHVAQLAQRYAMPLLADAAAICRSQAVEDLYGNIKAPTGETVINAFARMISSAVREYPILSKITTFDLGDARVVSLDLDEVAKTGGEMADRQTAVMYMLSRYVLARHYYLVEDLVNIIPKRYQEYHLKRIKEIREDPKRIVYDEFHRTANAKAVRDQVIVDMREGRKWKVHVALLSIADFDKVMIEFATSIFILDAGPKQSVETTAQTFGLSETAKAALESRVHGPSSSGANMLAIFSTKYGTNTQLITSTIGPIELWAFNTSADDVRIRNALYQSLGAKKARQVLATFFPTGSASKVIEEKLASLKDSDGYVSKEKANSIIDQVVDDVLKKYQSDPRFKE